MKINVTLSSSEKSYIQRTIAKVFPSYDQTNLWTDMESKFPAFRSAQITDQSGNVEGILDINPEFIMDVTDVCGEVIEKAKGFAFMLKGAWEGVKQYGKELAQRFDRWLPEMSSEAAYKEAESSAQHHVDDLCHNDSRHEFVAVIVNTDKEKLGESDRVVSHSLSDNSFADLKERVAEYAKNPNLGSNPSIFYFGVTEDFQVTQITEEETMSVEIMAARAIAEIGMAKLNRPEGDDHDYIVVVNDKVVSTCYGYEIKTWLDNPGKVFIFKMVGKNAEYANSSINAMMDDNSTGGDYEDARKRAEKLASEQPAYRGNFAVICGTLEFLCINLYSVQEKISMLTESDEEIASNNIYVFKIDEDNNVIFITSVSTKKEDK